jgi:hypothetical protein
MNYRTKGAKVKILKAPPTHQPIHLDDKIVACKANNIGTDKCDACEHKFKCLLVEIPLDGQPAQSKRIKRIRSPINTINVKIYGWDYEGVLGDTFYSKVNDFIDKIIITLDIEKGGKVSIAKINDVEYNE